MKDLFKNRGLAFYFSIAAAVIAIVAIIAYTFANKAMTNMVAITYLLGVAALASTVLAMLFDWKGIFSIIAPALFIAMGIVAFYDNATAFALYFNGVAQGESDMGGPNMAFWVCMISIVVGFVLSAVGSFFDQIKIKNK